MTTALFGVPRSGKSGQRQGNDPADTTEQPVRNRDVCGAVRWLTISIASACNGRYMSRPMVTSEQGRNVGKFFVRNAAGGMVPLSTLTTTYPRNGAEFDAVQPVQLRAD